MSKNFRYDINGLRAYAVILVVMFHFGIKGFSAGFIGVDIFFVISGFLMTSIIIESLEKGNFSLFNFYLARGVRIIPALMFLCITLMILGWFFLLPTDYKSLSKHVLSSINFFSNIVYWKESGYFDTDSHNKALLHTWSLSVEWQFYLIYPIIITCLYKIRPSLHFIVFFLITGAILSFILSVIITNKSPSAGFFLLPTRAWEMLVGGLIYFIPNNKIKHKKIIEIIGFSLFFLSCYIFSTSTLWPSYNALIPVIGTFLILISNQQDSLFTKGYLFQWLGNNSYSIYLWHWPIVFFINYFYKNNSYYYITIGLVISIMLGWLSFKCIESPSRLKIKGKEKKIFTIWLLFSLLFTFFCLIVLKTNGHNHINSKDILNILKYKNDKDPQIEKCLKPYGIEKCYYGDISKNKIGLIVIGDSHANSMMGGIVKSLPKNTYLISYTMSLCPTIKNIKKINDSRYNCGTEIERITKEINNYPKDIPILVVNRINYVLGLSEDIKKPNLYISNQHVNFSNEYYQEMQDAYIKTLGELSKNRAVYVTSPTPESKYDVPQLLAKVKYFKIDDINLRIKYKDFAKYSTKTNLAQKQASEMYGVKIIDITNYFCDINYCYFSVGNFPFFRDSHHMTWKESENLAPYFRKIFY